MLKLAAASHPLWLCGFRPFFLLTALSAVGLIALWGIFLGHGLPLPSVAGGPFIWHAHELIFGFSLAAVAGFALTAIPEFTGSTAIPPRPVRLLVALWLVGRIAFWLSGALGAPALAIAGLTHLGLVAGLVALLTPRLLADPERRHLSFLWALLVFALLIAGFYVDALQGKHPARWLYATVGLLMILIVIAMSRISMRIVNGAIDELNDANNADSATTTEYRARPPKRNLAIVCIALYTATEFFAPGARIGGWLALAAAAALCHLQSDWHVGRALFRRWPLMLFGVYLLMAAGYGLMGIALLAGSDAISAGRHLLTVGALGLNIYVVLNIAGRMHCGHELDERAWVPLGAALIAYAALLRAATALPGVPVNLLLAISSLCWLLPFALYIWHMGPLLAGPRSDGGTGCEGIISTQGVD
jgi:uncharacterized protein involved in response to NO